MKAVGPEWSPVAITGFSMAMAFAKGKPAWSRVRMRAVMK